MEEFSVLVGGAAGEGVRQTGRIIGRIFNRHGYYVFILDDYQSLIRGGHNFSKVRVSREKVWSHLEKVDCIIALNEDTIKRHESELKEDGFIIYDSDSFSYEGKFKSFGIPLKSLVKEVEGIEIMRNSAAIGFFSYLVGLDINLVKRVMEDVYKEKAEKNVKLVELAFKYAEEKGVQRVLNMEKTQNQPKPLLTGNEAIALGAVKGGLQIYVAYPMTPASSILHFFVNHKDELNVTVVQPENEIGVINMALGCAYAGARTMVGTSGGGFALMQEAFSLAGMSETPIVIVEAQRPGPSTGVPTYTSQGDLKFVLNAGHGEFPRIVLAPGDVEEAFYKTAEALNLAWKFQVPVVVLSDKHLSESVMTVEIDENSLTIEQPKLWDGKGEYKRYEDTDDGISPLAFPGTKNTIVKTSSYEHDEFGITTEEPQIVMKMYEKRFRKRKAIIEELKKRETIKVYGKEDSNIVVLSWGSTKGAVLEALKILDKPIKFIHVIYLEPFPTWELEKHLKNAEKIITVEGNYTSPLASLLAENMLIKPTHKIKKYDSREFEPTWLAKALEEVLG
ncbi:MAG: 2-oxoacid:acceptor oxidoreductase subunit alpha [Candidatus Aenigmarchaeota archaeon]|nr:2-oxoacid:acceptor oxidoreductase subunit alpha [Candidatus Aenigmarchaeota archaeon]